jgi:hypothetical protein
MIGKSLSSTDVIWLLSIRVVYTLAQKLFIKVLAIIYHYCI